MPKLHVARGAIRTLSFASIAATALPLVPTNAWWIRALDFPRPQIAVLLGLMTVGASLLLDRRRVPSSILLAALLAALGFQLYRVWPYTRWHPVQAETAETCAPADRLSVVVADLRASNSDAGLFLDALRRVDPDLIFIVEVDPVWIRALRPLEGAYPHRLLHPRDDYWGFALYARLDLVDPEVRHLLTHYVPSARTGLRLRSGAEVEFHGLHPKPPVPGQGTGPRDAELVLAAEAARRGDRAAVVGGDLNAVAWSDITGLMQRIGGLLDPRIGRGALPTFPTWLPEPLRVPIDHVLFTPGFRLLALERLPDVGSDHLPVFAALCHLPGGEPPAGPGVPHPTEADLRRARETVKNGRERASAAEAPQ